MKKDFVIINILDSVDKVVSIALEKNQRYFPVIEDGNFKGIVSYKELMFAHPNRIMADVVNDNFYIVPPDYSIWQAKLIFEENKVDVLFILEFDKITGILESSVLNLEIKKYYDPLTELYISGYIYSSAVEKIKKGDNLSIIFIDINNFGEINKKYGHTVGDTLIKQISEILLKSIAIDMNICRFGGDEFTILCNYNSEECESFAKNLQKKISSNVYIGVQSIGISIGIACYDIKKQKDESYYDQVKKLINFASIASTKAKKSDSKIHFVSTNDIEEMGSTL